MTRIHRATPLAAVLAPGCASGSARTHTPAGTGTTTTTMEAANLGGGLANFSPQIGATEEGGECRRYPMDGRDGAASLVLLGFPQATTPKRNVSVVIDSTGRLLHYNDLRGAIRRGDTGAKTFILLDFVRGTAQAVNQPAGETEDVYQGSADEALHDVNLGPPQRMIDMLRSRCGLP